MKILSATFKGFKRMKLNDVRVFTMTMTEMIQLILGTNGCGKSSMLLELTPLPADKSAYYSGGSKTIEITHRGSFYRSESSFVSGAKHYLWKDGELLNPGGTGPSMLEVVRQEFGITPEIQKLLTDQERFTRMSTGRRREWMTILADSNYDYAIGLFNRLKERSRDTTGALRRAREDLVAEKNKLISDAEEKKLTNEVNQLHHELSVLMEERAPLDNSVQYYESAADKALKEIDAAANRLLRMRLLAPRNRNSLVLLERNEWGEIERPHFNDEAEVKAVIANLSKNIAGTEALLNKAVSEHSKHTKAIESMERTGAEGVEGLQKKLREARDHKAAVLSKRKLKLEGMNGLAAHHAMENVYDELMRIFTNIPVNEDRRYSSANEEKLSDKLLGLTNTRNDLSNDLGRKNLAKQHMESHKKSGLIKCPKCAHQWTEGYNPDTYDRLVEAMGALEVKLAKVDAEIKTTQEELETNRVYGGHYRAFIQLTRAWRDLGPFWEYLLDNEYIVKNPRFAMSVVDTFRYDIEQEIVADKVAVEIVELLKFIQAAEETGDTSLAEARAHLDETQANIDEYTAILVDLRTNMREYENYSSDLATAIALGNTIEKLRVDAEHATHQMVEMMRRESITVCIRQLQSALGRKEDVLNHVYLQRGIIEQLESKLVLLEKEEEVLKHMVREISPTEGMIAEGLMGFIRIFTKQMNTLIKKVWSYPLVVLPCGQSDSNNTELDYRFPLIVKSNDDPHRDVSEGSTGHKEIIDIAFKVTAMEYLGLGEFPLLLDEFGPGFDEVHRNQAMQAVKNLMEQKSFTQLFMVSHYEASYGSLTQAEICVLCPANITIPSSMAYNKHVTIA